MMALKQFLLAVPVLLAAGWLTAQGWSGPRGLNRVRLDLARYYELSGDISGLERDNRRLEREIEFYKRDKFWLEKQAREKLGWVKPGEVVYKFKQLQ